MYAASIPSQQAYISNFVVPDIVIVPLWLPLLDKSELVVLIPSPPVEMIVKFAFSIVTESFPFNALLTALTYNVKFLISKSSFVWIPLL